MLIKVSNNLEFNLVSFPNFFSAGSLGLVAIGNNLSPSVLLSAYLQGCFPWPNEKFEGVPWCSPEERGILFFSKLHFSDRLLRYIRKVELKFSVNRAFSEVILGCQHGLRRTEKGTWISDSIVSAYYELHSLGLANSFECWQNGNLVAGLYGVGFNNYFAGESMFYLADNCSKFLLYWVCKCVLSGLDLKWMDTQMTTPILSNMGGNEILRDEFMLLLREATGFDPTGTSDCFLRPLFCENIGESFFTQDDLIAGYLSSNS